MGPEGQEVESARVLSLARDPHSEHSIFAAENEDPKTMGLACFTHTAKREPEEGNRSWCEDVTLCSFHCVLPGGQ